MILALGVVPCYEVRATDPSSCPPSQGAIALFLRMQRRNVVGAVDSSADLFQDMASAEDEMEREAREYRYDTCRAGGSPMARSQRNIPHLTRLPTRPRSSARRTFHMQHSNYPPHPCAPQGGDGAPIA